MLSVLGATLMGGGAQAACHLSLLLALDVSSSVDAREYAQQRDGLAGALLSGSVQSAIFSGGGSIALAVYEWSGRYQHQTILDWVLIETPDDLHDAVVRIRSANRSHDTFPTAMGFALGHGAGLMSMAPPCARQTIDISGDGISNDGFPPFMAYEHFPFKNVTVNGLVVRTADTEVRDFYVDEVIRGPDAFVIIADGYADYERAMQQKLLREIGVALIGSTRDPGGAHEG